MGTMESEQFFLKWNNFENNLTSGFADLLQQEAMVDVTLAAEGKIIQAHKVILSICSSYFRNMFQLNPCQHPIVVLKDVGYQELTDMLDFMYKGEANVRQEDLPSFLKLAETLKVKGLAGSPTESDNDSAKRSTESQIPNSTNHSMADERDEIPNETVENDSTLRKKRKRLNSPNKHSSTKPLSFSPNIKLEIDECENNYVESNIEMEDNMLVKGERLNENSLYSCDYSNPRNDKDAGPSNLEDSYEMVPQDQTDLKTTDYTFMESCYGGNLLVLNGHCFRRKSWNKDKSYWFCLKEGCPAKGILLSDLTFWMKSLDHNHKPDPEDMKKRQILLTLKKLALESNISAQALLKALNIREDIQKYLNFVRVWRWKKKKGGPIKPQPVNVGTEYEIKSYRLSSKGNLVHSGHKFRLDHEKQGTSPCRYWRCCYKGCKVRGKTDAAGNLILSHNKHEHPHKNEKA